MAALDDMISASRPTINMPAEVCDDLLRGTKYRNYNQRVENNERTPATELNHSTRISVGAKLFPAYDENIVYAALSPNDKGIANYGPVAVRWEVTPIYLEPRISLLEENSYGFFTRHKLGEMTSTVPDGYRAVWEDRAELAIAKLSDRLSSAITRDELVALVLKGAQSLSEDEFIEIHIFADKGVDGDDITSVTLQGPLDGDSSFRFELVRAACERRKIPVSVATLLAESHAH